MKRSQAIELIAKRLNPIGICDETCEEVLIILEKAGMLPPEAVFEVMPEQYDEYGGENLGLDYVKISANKWEPES